MLVCIIKRSKQEAIYLLKIVFTQSSEFNFICKLHNTLYDSVVPLTYNDEQLAVSPRFLMDPLDSDFDVAFIHTYLCVR